jgi:hypothetical protein
MLSFVQYILEVALSASGNRAEYHASKYLDPYIGGKEGIKHILRSPTKIGDTTHPAGTEITIHSTRDERGNRIARGKRNAFHSVVSVNNGPKHEIANSKIQKPKLGTSNAVNTHFGNAFEAHTIYRLHRMTNSLNNQDPEHQKRIIAIKKLRNESLSKLPKHLQKEAIRLARNASNAYLSSLKNNHNISADDIHEVHLTNNGISQAIGRKVSQRANPHDLIIKTKDGKFHGASLKAREGTVSNNGLKTFDEHSIFNGKHTNVKSTWSGQTNGEAAANHHQQEFNSGSLEEKKAHLHYLFKSQPDVSYDYVDANKNKAIPIGIHPNVKSLINATNIRAEHRGANVHFYDQDGKHLAYVEHRRPGKGKSPQANAKFGSLK